MDDGLAAMRVMDAIERSARNGAAVTRRARLAAPAVMRLGIFARTLARPTLGETLDAVAASGVQTIQFNMALAGGLSLPPSVPVAQAAEIGAAVAARGLDMAAVSGTYNMAHPDARVRNEGGAALAALIAAAPAHGHPRGHAVHRHPRSPTTPGGPTPTTRHAEAWRDAVEAVGAALAVAERHGVVLAFEPEHGNVVSGARAARRLLDELRSDHLKVVVDAANLIVPGELDRQRQTLEEAFALLGDAIVLAHAKDMREDGRVVAPGRGGLDYGSYVELLTAAGYDGPLVLHGIAEAEVPAAARHVREHLGVRPPRTSRAS